MKICNRNTHGLLPLVLLLGLVAPAHARVSSNESHHANGRAEASISGDLKQWHKVTLTLDGPEAAENGTPNPFLDYRMQVTFRHKSTGLTYQVPGYFAADGDSANTSATQGNKWRAHLSPDHVGEWSYAVSFRAGPNVAVSDEPEAGEPVASVEGVSGTFQIEETDKQGRDLRSKGRLEYVGKHHLQFAGTGEFFLKAGVDAPENLLAYEDFDGDFKTDGQKDQLIKNWAPHVRDWRRGDPTWQDGKGKGLIGAINYLASQGLNSFSFLTLNIDGDDRNAFPYTSYDERERIDCSRMDQWEVVFEHGTKMGMYLHFKTQEAENVNLLDDGQLGPQRKLYYRELIARFGHHLALNWNLGEEVGLGFEVSTQQKQDWAEYFRAHDPYHHHIVIHNGNSHFDLLGDASALTGFSLQTNQPDFSRVHNRTKEYLRRSVAAGKPWVVACDEPGDASHSLVTDDEDPTHDNARKNALWGNIMAGGAGVEWYFGYQHPQSDLTCQDYRVREAMWQQCRVALEFFATEEIPFWGMGNANERLSTKNDYCFCSPGELYLVYLKGGNSTDLDLADADGVFEVLWFNPRAGGPLVSGTTKAVNGGDTVSVGHPPSDRDQDWLAVIRPGDAKRNYPPSVTVAPDMGVMLPRTGNEVEVKLQGSVADDRTSTDDIKTNWSKVSGPGDAHFDDAADTETVVTLQDPGSYVFKLVANDGTQDSSATVTILVEPFQAIVTRSIGAVDDAYIEGTNVLDNMHLKIEGNRRVAYIKFDLPNFPSSLSQVALQLTEAGDPGNGRIRIYAGENSDWTSKTLTKQTAPAMGELLAEHDAQVGQGETISIPIPEMKSASGTHTLIVTLDQRGNDIWFGAQGSGKGPKLLVTFEDPEGQFTTAEEMTEETEQDAVSEPAEKPFEFNYDPKTAKKVHVQTDGIVVIEAEDYDSVDRDEKRKWYLTTSETTPGIQPDPDPNHAEGAVGEAYLELLPDTRVTHSDPLVHGVSFAPQGGQCSVLYYPVVFTEPGRYYVWARICCTGSEDNGLHVGLDGKWPASGQRLQWTGKHGEWQWDSRQRTAEVHVGELGKIWLDIEEPGLHTIMFSMREDGFEFDRFMLTKEREAMESKNSEPGPPASPKQ